ncbi:MAG: hypothetical protein JJT96_13740 [Opitutales bacterium]|nr:hypothetical protein [Opitutales bacterium]
MDRRHQLRAHFVPVSLLEALPNLAALPSSGWYGEPGAAPVAPATSDWSYHFHLGWFHHGTADEAGAWLWFAEHGWLWRPKGIELYHDSSTGAWLID